MSNPTSHQHAPSPDYSTGEVFPKEVIDRCIDPSLPADTQQAIVSGRVKHIQLLSYDTEALIVTKCPDCHDLILTESILDRCEACAQYDADTRASAERAVVAALDRAIVRETERTAAKKRALLTVNRSPDYRDITCRECGEASGLTFTGPVDALDGNEGTCGECLTPGVVVVDSDDEGHATIYFRGAP